ncbi:MAG: quinolinate synthase NadA [Thermodesulfobacteriota bacterium]|nr:quinolinate synthase NadA [Thermodesulfobacteriota bacterium]
MDNRKLQGDIKKLLKEKNGILLVHNYQRDEIQEIADLTGDSLGLSIEAAKTNAELIVFCGVHFMAETASILSPQKTVILPRMDAGCPMADMITQNSLSKMKDIHPDAVVVTYVNTPASVKAESDICCTSANAVSVVKAQKDTPKIIFTPDKNLGLYVSRFTEKEVIYWNGYCPVHDNLTAEDVLKVKENYPDAVFMAHPECKPEVIDLSDHVTSTSGMYDYARSISAQQIIVGTEMGILYGLKKANPEKHFILASEKLICPDMKLTTLEATLESLETMKNIVHVADDIRKHARKSLDRMLTVPRD